MAVCSSGCYAYSRGLAQPERRGYGRIARPPEASDADGHVPHHDRKRAGGHSPPNSPDCPSQHTPAGTTGATASRGSHRCAGHRPPGHKAGALCGIGIQDSVGRIISGNRIWQSQRGRCTHSLHPYTTKPGRRSRFHQTHPKHSGNVAIDRRGHRATEVQLCDGERGP